MVSPPTVGEGYASDGFGIIQYACPECSAGYAVAEHRAGTETDCDYCKAAFTIPTGLQPQLLTVAAGPGRSLTTEETEAFYQTPAGRSHRPQAALAVVPADSDYDRPVRPEEAGPLVASGKPRHGTVPIKMGLPKGLGTFEATVRQGTADKMATTFLGALIMAVGVALAAMLGLRKRS
jgi:hypothetical protein